jgi:parallel beta-helix repeat protein
VATPTPTPVVPAFYVSVNGNDSGNGSASNPFATLARAEQAMEGSSIKTTYVEGGTYNLSSALNLTSADDGISFIAAPGQTPILNGGASGLSNLITLNGANNVTLQGLTFENTGSAYAGGAVALTNSSGDQIIANNFNNNDTGVYLFGSNNNLISGNAIDNSGSWGVEVSNGSANNTVDSNMFSGSALYGTGGGSGAIELINAGSDNAVTHNAISNMAGSAIEVMTWYPNSSADFDNNETIAYNSIVNADSATSGWVGEGGSQDSGAIYLASTQGNNENILIDHNYIDTLTDPSSGLDVGIYLDNWASGINVTNNTVVGGNMSFLIHGGANDTLSNNIFDVGPNTESNLGAGLIQGLDSGFGENAPVSMSNDNVTGNIIYSTANGTSNAYVVYGGTANVSGNLYYNSNGNSINTDGVDSNPVSGNPQFSNAAGGDFNLGGGSAAGSIGFQNIDQSSIGLAPKTLTAW